MLKKSKKIVSLLLAVVICFTLPLSVFAASKTFGISTSLGLNTMMIQGWKGTTTDSNSVYFNVNLSGKMIRSITVHIGSSSRSGTIVGNTMTLINTTTGYYGTTAWGGGDKTSVTFNSSNSNFFDTPASGIYELYYNGTVLGNTTGNPLFGIPDSEAIRGYKGSEIKLEIEYY